MAQVLTVVMRRQNNVGIACNSSRPIVVWGEPVTQCDLDKLELMLSEERQLAGINGPTPQSVIIKTVCDKVFPGRWDFVAQGCKVEF